MPDPPVLHAARLEVSDRVARLTLDRDDVRNELTGTGLAGEIAAVARWVNEAPEVSVLVITGSGRAFSAGGNIKDMLARDGAFAGDVHELQDTYRHGIQQLTLAMHAGYAIYFPELFPTRLRATGAGFCFNVGRVVAASMVFFSAWLKRQMELRQALSLSGVLFLLGIIIIQFMPETKGQPLPE